MESKLLSLSCNGRNWMKKEDEDEERKLELRLGPPGGENSVGSLLGCPKKMAKCNGSSVGDRRQVFLASAERKTEGLQQQPQMQQCGFLHLSQEKSVRVDQQSVEKKARAQVTSTNPVVGWPPVRSFRKNLASASPLKAPLGSQKESSEPSTKMEKPKNSLVKINMEGIPIGRKVDLKAYDSYYKLSLAVDDLFRGLLAAQADTRTNRKQTPKEKQAITGLLDGSGEYTLVYEDDEGDRMLAGDVPWDMFVSTAKRLHVLKTSELSSSTLGSAGRKRTANEC